MQTSSSYSNSKLPTFLIGRPFPLARLARRGFAARSFLLIVLLIVAVLQLLLIGFVLLLGGSQESVSIDGRAACARYPVRDPLPIAKPLSARHQMEATSPHSRPRHRSGAPWTAEPRFQAHSAHKIGQEVLC